MIHRILRCVILLCVLFEHKLVYGASNILQNLRRKLINLCLLLQLVNDEAVGLPGEQSGNHAKKARRIKFEETFHQIVFSLILLALCLLSGHNEIFVRREQIGYLVNVRLPKTVR